MTDVVGRVVPLGAGAELRGRRAQEHQRIRVHDMHTALALREAVQAFNGRPVTEASIDSFRERVLEIADWLSPR